MPLDFKKQPKAAGLALTAERLAAIFEHASVGIVVLGADRLIAAVNPHFCELLQRPREELIGQDVLALTHPDDVARDAKMLADFQADRLSTASVDKRYVRSDGTSIWCNLTASIVRERDGTTVLYGFVTGIEKKKRLEEEAKENFAILDAFFRHSDLEMGVVELRGDDDLIHLFDSGPLKKRMHELGGDLANKTARERQADPNNLRFWLDRFQDADRLGSVNFELSQMRYGRLHHLTATASRLDPVRPDDTRRR